MAGIGVYIGAAALALVFLLLVVLYARARHRGIQEGATRVVRCGQGHLFTTTWIPGASFKAVRLGRERYQRCPVGNHWTLVRTVDPATLTPADRARAESVRDGRLP